MREEVIRSSEAQGRVTGAANGCGSYLKGNGCGSYLNGCGSYLNGCGSFAGRVSGVAPVRQAWAAARAALR